MKKLEGKKKTCQPPQKGSKLPQKREGKITFFEFMLGGLWNE